MWHCQLILVFYIAIKLKDISAWCKGRHKKTGYFTVRVTASVYHPPPLTVSFLWIIFWCTFDLIFWLFMFWNGFYTRKVIFIQLQEFPTPPYCRCCSVTKGSDSGIAEALKALKMHFWDPSKLDKMCFEYHRVIFHWRNGSRFSHLLTVSLTVKYTFFTPWSLSMNLLKYHNCKKNCLRWQTKIE